MSQVTVYAPGATIELVVKRQFYVSMSGSDGNDGLTQLTPFATLAKADAVANQPGDLIALKRGDVWSSETALKISHGGIAGLTIVWDGGFWGSGANAVIRSSGNRGPQNMAVINIVGTSHVTFQNITVDGNNTQTFGLVIGGGSNSYYSVGAVQNGERCITVQDCTIKNCGNGGDYRLGVLVQTWHNDMAEIVLRRLTVDGTDDQAIGLYPGKTQDGAVPKEIRDCYIGHCTIINSGRRNTSTAIAMMVNNRCTNVVIEHNDISTGTAGHGTAFSLDSNESDAAYFPTGIVVRYNRFKVSTGWAIFIQSGRAKSADVYYNEIVSDTTHAGSGGGGVIIYAASPGYAGANLHFFNNTIRTAGGIGFYDGTSSAVVTLKNNLIYNAGADQYGNKALHLTAPGTVHSNNAMFRAHGATDAVVWDGAGFRYRASLNAWEPTAIAADPLLNADLTLQSGSPCVGAGVGVGLTEDFSGVPVPTTPNIGAHQ